VREKSHIDDMRSAIRGDFERLAERRGGQELMREPAEPVSRDEAPEKPVSRDEAPETPLEEEPVAAIVFEEATEPAEELAEPVVDDVEPEEPPPRRSWLDKLLGR
jgi:hypothetical protein